MGGGDPGVDVDPAVAARLRPAGEPDLGEHLAQRVGGLHGIREGATRLGVEVDAELVWVVVVGGAHRPGVERHGVHLHGPHRGGDLVDDDLRVPPAARVAAGHGAHPVGHALRRVLLVELLAVDALREPLQRDRAVADVVDERVPDRLDVCREVALGDAGVGPHDAVRTGEAHLADPLGTFHLQHLRVRHAASLTTGADGRVVKGTCRPARSNRGGRTRGRDGGRAVALTAGRAGRRMPGTISGAALLGWT